MYPVLVHIHSVLRWILLIMIIVNVLNALGGYGGNKTVGSGDKKLSLIALICTHTQVLVGLGLYAISPKVQFSASTMSNGMLRFFTMEHTVMMLIAVVLVTIGHRAVKSGSFKKEFWYYLIALVIMLAAIPWPFRAMLGGTWF